jgi:small GTP-binding protein
MERNKRKTITIGNSSVGKSSIVMRLCQKVFYESRESTIGASFLTYSKLIDNYNIKFEIWDTAGQERYKSLIPMYLRGAQIIIFVFDLTDVSTFDKLITTWIPEILEKTDNKHCLYYVLGNKNDLYENGLYGMIDRLVESGLSKFKNINLKYYKTSAKSGENIEEMFEDAGKKVIEMGDFEEDEGAKVIYLDNEEKSDLFNCCN